MSRILSELVLRKNLIAMSAIIGGVLGIAMMFLGTINGAPATAVVTAAEQSEFNKILAPDVYSITNDQALDRLVRELNRRTTALTAIERFISKKPPVPFLASLSAVTMSTDRISFSALRTDDNEREIATGRNVRVIVKGTHPAIGMWLLNELFVLAEENAIAETRRERASAIETEQTRLRFVLSATTPQRLNMRLLQKELEALQQEARAKRDALILQLQEGIRIAGAAGIIKPAPAAAPVIVSTDPTRALGIQGLDGRSGPLFLYGVEALSEQLKVMQQRSSDDHDDPRIIEIKRDILLASRTESGTVVRIRGTREGMSEGEDKMFDGFLQSIQRLSAIEALQVTQPVFNMLDVVRSPSRGSYSDAVNLLVNILRGAVLAMVFAIFWISGRYAMRMVRKPDDMA